ncbi:MAG TPA: hypothetical protein VKS60_10080, partial [Stellaceae bacterium]|nr:hypothetical protein [Stellaceae bacterium]
VLPLLWAKLEKEREARRQQAEHLAEAERQQAEHLAEAKRQEVERHTQQARETWARMLLISHRNATLHYLPLLSTLRDLADRLWLRDFPAWQDEAFFQLMTLLVLMKRLRDKAGGFYLKSRLGEDILSDLWLLLKHACQRTLGLADYTAALDEMGGAESYAAFSTSLTAVPAQRPALLRCRLAFDTWVVNPDLPLSAYAPLLRLFYYVLRYETNRSYVYWYGTVEEPPNAELARWTEQLTGGKLGHAAWKRGILAELGKYQKEARESYLYLNSRLKPE